MSFDELMMAVGDWGVFKGVVLERLVMLVGMYVLLSLPVVVFAFVLILRNSPEIKMRVERAVIMGALGFLAYNLFSHAPHGLRLFGK